MTFSGVTARGTATEDNLDASTTLTPTGTISAGKLAVVKFLIDNVSTTDGDTTDVTISDDAGNTWTRAFERTESSGSAGDGVTEGLWWSILDNDLTTSSTITLTVGSNSQNKHLTLTEVTFSESSVEVASVATVQAGSWTTDDPADVVLSGMASGEKLLFALVGFEGENGTLTQDGDYTQLAALNTGAAGAATDNLELWTAYRIASLTGDTYTASRDVPAGPQQTSTGHVAALVAFQEVVSSTDAEADIAWAELEVPTPNATAQVAWAEVEVPTPNARADIAWTELEVPTPNADGEIAWAAFEVPDVGVTNSEADIAWAEFEVPTPNAAAEIAWTELEVPTPNATGEIAWAELEVPTPNATGEVSWAELEVPTPGGAEISWAVFELGDEAVRSRVRLVYHFIVRGG